MPNLARCGTGNTGCNGQGEPTYPRFGSMCNGVFAPVCAPEICNVPRIPHHETLVTGHGILLDTISQQNINFNLLIERTMQVYKGYLYLNGPSLFIDLSNSILKLFESDGQHSMTAVFYDESTNRNMIVTLHQDHMTHTSQLLIYSSSNLTDLIHIQGNVIFGDTYIAMDHNVHAH